MLSLLPQKNLVLVVDEARCDPADFIDIANRIRSQAADIRVQVLQPKVIHSIARDTWDHPTLFYASSTFPICGSSAAIYWSPAPSPSYNNPR